MRFTIPGEPIALAAYLPEFMTLFGSDRWLKRANQLADEAQRSPYIQKIVLDYHWLEMNICHQWQVFTQESRVDLHALRELNLASLNFAATAVEIYRHLGKKGKRVFGGRVFDALKAENGFSALYLEVSLVQRLLSYGFDVDLPDMEGTGQFDILFYRDGLSAEIECKSQSVDAGRQIHRKHFYRLMATLQSDKNLGLSKCQQLVLVTITGRLSADLTQQALLANAIRSLAASTEASTAESSSFKLRKYRIDEIAGLENGLHRPELLYAALNQAFGSNLHVAGWPGVGGGSLVVMRSTKVDDTSLPLLDAMRKGASQLSKTRPGFLAIQEHGMMSHDLFLQHVQRRASILSGALFNEYQAHHVNAVYVTGYAAVIDEQHRLRTPGFAVANLRAKPRVKDEYAAALINVLLQGLPPETSTTLD